MMKTVMIRLSIAEQVKRFVSIVGKYDMPMDLRSGRCVVNAKSILGLFSLDLSRPIRLEIDEASGKCEETDKLLKEIAGFTVDKEMNGGK